MVQDGDAPPARHWTYHDLGTLPRQLDIVWCRFPFKIAEMEPGPYARPGLVRQRQVDIQNRRGAVQIVYGTTNLKPGRRVLDLTIMNSSTIDELGLREATRFDLDATVTLPWCVEFFKAPRGLPLLIGSLRNSPRAMDQLATLKHLRERVDRLRAAAVENGAAKPE